MEYVIIMSTAKISTQTPKNEYWAWRKISSMNELWHLSHLFLLARHYMIILCRCEHPFLADHVTETFSNIRTPLRSYAIMQSSGNYMKGVCTLCACWSRDKALPTHLIRHHFVPFSLVMLCCVVIMFYLLILIMIIHSPTLYCLYSLVHLWFVALYISDLVILIVFVIFDCVVCNTSF